MPSLSAYYFICGSAALPNAIILFATTILQHGRLFDCGFRGKAASIWKHSGYIVFTHPIIPHKPIQIHAPTLLNRIPRRPPPRLRIVPPIPVIQPPRPRLDRLRAEPPRVLRRLGPGHFGDVPERIVGVGGDDGTSPVDQLADVAVGVVSREEGFRFEVSSFKLGSARFVRARVDLTDRQQASDAARTLERTAQIPTPSVIADGVRLFTRDS